MLKDGAMRSPLAVTLVALALTGCGAAPEKPQQPSPSAVAGSVRHPSPEEAGQAFLRALGHQDAVGACRVTAAGGTVVETEPAVMEMCVSAMTQAASAASASAGDALQQATVSGVRVDGDHADFADAAVTPVAAGQFLRQMKAVRIGGGWYVSD